MDSPSLPQWAKDLINFGIPVSDNLTLDQALHHYIFHGVLPEDKEVKQEILNLITSTEVPGQVNKRAKQVRKGYRDLRAAEEERKEKERLRHAQQVLKQKRRARLHSRPVIRLTSHVRDNHHRR